MSSAGLDAAQAKMNAAGVSQAAIDVFSHYYGELEVGATGLIAEADIEPLLSPPHCADVDVYPDAAREALARTAIIKLNGGLGTSMGMDRAKSLLAVHDGASFLDLTVRQVQAARRLTGAALPLVLMNSFRTSADTVAALAPYPDIAVPGVALEFLQHKEPKLTADTLEPVSWPADPELEWCPPGHGDIYPAALASGILDQLLAAGMRYAMVSNSDNLGAVPDARIAGWFAASGAPFAVEVCQRTDADRKGGHLARRRRDGRLVVRESAQTSPADMAAFMDPARHAYFNTNTLWWDIRALRDELTARGGVLGLPLIRNLKTVDPADPASPAVVQLETAMAAAVEVFDHAQAIEVDRARFVPVKTTADLLVLRSDVYEFGADGRPHARTQTLPVVDLDPTYYRTIADFDARFAQGVPSLVGAHRFTVRGDWTFGRNVSVRGEASLIAHDAAPHHVADHTVIDGEFVGHS